MTSLLSEGEPPGVNSEVEPQNDLNMVEVKEEPFDNYAANVFTVEVKKDSDEGVSATDIKEEPDDNPSKFKITKESEGYNCTSVAHSSCPSSLSNEQNQNNENESQNVQSHNAMIKNEDTGTGETSVDIKPDITQVKVENVGNTDTDKLKSVLDAVNMKMETHPNEKNVDFDDTKQVIKQENIKEELVPDQPEEQQSYVRSNVIELLKASGYAEKATEENIRQIVGWLMNGMLPTEAELHSLFNAQTTSSGDGASHQIKEEMEAEVDTRSTNESISKKKATTTTGDASSQGESATTATTTKRKRSAPRSYKKKGKKSKKQGGGQTKNGSTVENRESSSPPDLSPVKPWDVPDHGEQDEEARTSPSRYSLRRKPKKSFAEGLSPTEDFWDEDSDEWTPEQTRKEDSEAFLQSRRKKSLQNQLECVLFKRKKSASGASDKVSVMNPGENSQGKGNKRKKDNNRNIEVGNKKRVVIPGSGNTVVMIDQSVCDELLSKDKYKVKLSEKTLAMTENETTKGSENKKADNIKVKKSYFVTAKTETNQFNHQTGEKMKPTTNVTTEIMTTTNIKNNEIITNITKTEIKTITHTEIIKTLPVNGKNNKQMKAIEKSSPATSAITTNTTTTTRIGAGNKTESNGNVTMNNKQSNEKGTKSIVDVVHACTKCILAFSSRHLLQRHMFRLHYDEYLRLRDENFWEGLQLV